VNLTKSKPGECKIVWILPEGHLGLPKSLEAMGVGVYRLRSHSRTAPFRSNRGGILAWDWRRTGEQTERCIETLIDSLNELPASTEGVPVVVSGSEALAERLSRSLCRPVHWLSIGGYGATDPKAVWASWLAGSPSVSIELTLCRDGGCRKHFGRRELRTHPSSPAITQMALLGASLALVEPLTLAEGAGSCSTSERALASSTNCSRIQSWSRPVHVSLRIAAKTLLNRLTRGNRLADQWVIGVGEMGPASAKASLPGVPQFRDLHWIEPGAHRFIADPFLARLGETKTLFFEELLYSDWKGRLKALPLDSYGRPVGPEVIVLEKPYHLSYPCVFEHPSDPDAIFLLPEQAASGNTVLYRSPRATKPSLLRFEQDTVLLPGLPGIDPGIVEWGKQFYLFVTNGSYGNVDNNLQLFVSENLRGPYKPHPKNPIKLGLYGSRMAGPLLVHAGNLYRPAQDCKSAYGARVILHRVGLLSPTEYRETEVGIFAPDTSSPYGLGSHTVVWHEGLVATDGLRRIAHP